MSSKYELSAVSSTNPEIDVLTYGHIENQRDPYGFLRLPDGRVANLLQHQVVASEDGFLADFTHHGRIRPPLDFVGNKLVMAIPRLTFDPEHGLWVPMPWLITSDRDLFPLKPKELTARGLYSKVPLDDIAVPPRYSAETLKGFLEGRLKGNLVETFQLVRTVLESCVDLRHPQHYGFLALWVIGTYMFEGFNSFPYLHFNGPKGVGKTTALDMLSVLCFNGELTPNISAPAQFRLIPSCSPTLLIDEGEKFHRKNLTDESAILLAGYKRGGAARRSVQGKGGWQPGRYDVYTPRAFASQAGFEDVLGSRTIKILMSRTTRSLKRLTEQEAEGVRDALFLTTMSYAPIIRDVYEEMADPAGIVPFDGREYELFRPILAIATATEDASVVAEATDFAIDSHKGQVADFCESSTEHAYLSFLVEAVAEDGEYRGDVLLEAFKDYASDHDIELSKPLTVRSQGQLLVSLGLTDRTKRKRTADNTARLYALTRAGIVRAARAYHVVA